MSSKFQKKSAGVIASFFIGLIIISFIFTGQYQGGMGPSGTEVATVNGSPIKANEYRSALNQRIELFQQMMGGKTLTTAQINQFRIRESVLNTLIEQKLFSHFSESLGLNPGPQEIKEEITKQPYFKNNKKFNFEIYKALLAQNGLSPADYEASMSNMLKLQKVGEIISNVPISEGHAKDILELKNNKLSLRVLKIEKKALNSFLKVPKKDIQAYAENQEYLKKMQTYFRKNRQSWQSPERIKARHILIRVDKKQDPKKALKTIQDLAKKVTPKNFSKMARQFSQDPMSQKKGGELGIFGRNSMVPEFEKVAFSLTPGVVSSPVKTAFGHHLILVDQKFEAINPSFEEKKQEIARELLVKSKTLALQELYTQKTKKFEKLLKQNAQAKIIREQKSYNYQFAPEKTINFLDGSLDFHTFSPSEIKRLFTHKGHVNKTLTFETVSDIVIVAINKDKLRGGPKEGESSLDLRTIKSEQARLFSEDLRKTILKSLREKAKITTSKNLI